MPDIKEENGVVIFDTNFFIYGFETYPKRLDIIKESVEKIGMKPVTTNLIVDELKYLYLKNAVKENIEIVNIDKSYVENLRGTIGRQFGTFPSINDISLIAITKSTNAIIVTNDLLLIETVKCLTTSKVKKYENIKARTPSAFLSLLGEKIGDGKLKEEIETLQKEMLEKEIQYGIKTASHTRIMESFFQTFEDIREEKRRIREAEDVYLYEYTPFQEKLVELTETFKKSSIDSAQPERLVHSYFEKSCELFRLAALETERFTPKILSECIPHMINAGLETAIYWISKDEVNTAAEILDKCILLGSSSDKDVSKLVVYPGFYKAILGCFNFEFEEVRNILDALCHRKDEIQKDIQELIDVLLLTIDAIKNGSGYIVYPFKFSDTQIDFIMNVADQFCLKQKLEEAWIVLSLAVFNTNNEAKLKNIDEKLGIIILQNQLCYKNTALSEKISQFKEMEEKFVFSFSKSKQALEIPIGEYEESPNYFGKYTPITDIHSEFSQTMDIIERLESIVGEKHTTYLFCRNWALKANICIYDSRNVVPPDIHDYWKINLAQGKYKINHVSVDHIRKKAPLIIFPSFWDPIEIKCQGPTRIEKIIAEIT